MVGTDELILKEFFKKLYTPVSVYTPVTLQPAFSLMLSNSSVAGIISDNDFYVVVGASAFIFDAQYDLDYIPVGDFSILPNDLFARHLRSDCWYERMKILKRILKENVKNVYSPYSL